MDIFVESNKRQKTDSDGEDNTDEEDSSNLLSREYGNSGVAPDETQVGAYKQDYDQSPSRRASSLSPGPDRALDMKTTNKDRNRMYNTPASHQQNNDGSSPTNYSIKNMVAGLDTSNSHLMNNSFTESEPSTDELVKDSSGNDNDLVLEGRKGGGNNNNNGSSNLKKERKSSLSENEQDHQERDNNLRNSKDHYLKALAAEGLRVGRHISRMMKTPTIPKHNHHQHSHSHHNNQYGFGNNNNNNIQNSNAHTTSNRGRRGAVAASAAATATMLLERQSQQPQQISPPSSPAVDTLLRVFPTKRRCDIDAALSKSCGDVLKAIEVLLVAGEVENHLFLNHHHQQHQPRSHHHQQQQLHHQLSQLHAQNPMAVSQLLHHHQQQQQPHFQQHRSNGGGGGGNRSAMSCFPPTVSPTSDDFAQHLHRSGGPMDLAIDPQKLIEHAFEKGHFNPLKTSPNNNQLNHPFFGNPNPSVNNISHHLQQQHSPTEGSRLPSPSGSESPSSAFSFFAPYTAAAAAAAAAARFNPNHPGGRRFMPSLLPYGIPGLPRPADFYPGGGASPLVTAAAAAAMSTAAAALDLGTHCQNNNSSSNNGNGNNHGSNSNTLPVGSGGSVHTSPGTPGSAGSHSEANMGNVGERDCNATPPTSCSGSDRASYSE